jgi:hypothetical protein
MKQLVKLQEYPPFYSEEEFSSSVHVQGGEKRTYQNALLINSGGRYKLYTDGEDRILICAGNGYFKWVRGETPFHEGEVFLAEEVGEYEINGKVTFQVIRER